MEYLDRESHYVWGKRYLLKVVEADQPPAVELSHWRMILQIRRGTNTARRQAILDEWYREQVRDAVPQLIDKWERLMGVGVRRFFVQRMKTKWGKLQSPGASSIRLNTDLARKPKECLEYIVVHEMAHLLRTHAQRALHGLPGSVHAQVGILPRASKQTARPERELGLLKMPVSAAKQLFKSAALYLDLIDRIIPIAAEHTYTFVSSDRRHCDACCGRDMPRCCAGASKSFATSSVIDVRLQGLCTSLN